MSRTSSREVSSKTQPSRLHVEGKRGKSSFCVIIIYSFNKYSLPVSPANKEKPTETGITQAKV
nr:hypothetical protein [Parabacteroides sp. AD58]MCM6900838.1 hypothetical protein [Parabacteroides sp. AD58]